MRPLPIAFAAAFWLLSVTDASTAGTRTSALQTSRWWKLACSEAAGPGATEAPACILTVRLRGRIDRSRLHLVEEAIRRGDAAGRGLGRSVELRLDVDTHGGEVFAAMEIGRILRRRAASVHVGARAECVSACIFVLMGATERSLAVGARVGIHRPSLGDAGNEVLVAAMMDPIVLYAQQMNVPRGIVDDMMAIPASRVRYLTPAELTSYGVATSTADATYLR